MSVSFSPADADHLRATLQAISSPLASPSLGAWYGLVNEHLSKLFQADSVAATCLLPDASSSVHEIGLSDGGLSDYRSHWQYLDHTPAEIQKRDLRVISTSILCEPYHDSLRPYQESAIYHEYYHPNKMEDFIGIVVRPVLLSNTRAREFSNTPLPAWGPMTLFWGAHRTRFGTELFGEKGALLMNVLRPVIEASLEAYFMLATWRTALEQSLDLMSEAVWLCSRNGEVLHENAAMCRLLSADPERTRLRASLHHSLKTLTNLYGGTRRKRDYGAPTMDLPTVRTTRGTYRIRGSSIQGFESEPDSQPALLLILEEISNEVRPFQDLMEKFDLTRQEGHVALLLADRRRNEEIADALAISPNTARRHTQNVLAKLGIGSRDDVAGLMKFS